MKRYLLLEAIPDSEKLFLTLKEVTKHTGKYFGYHFTNISYNALLLRQLVENFFGDKFTRAYEKNGQDVTKVLAWLENIAFDYSKWNNAAGNCAYNKLHCVSKIAYPYDSNTFAEEKKELKELRLRLKKFITLCKIDQFIKTEAKKFKNINSHKDVAPEIKRLELKRVYRVILRKTRVR